MQVHIQIRVPGSDSTEWVLVELQGDLESRTQEPMKGKFIGDLSFTKKGVPVLIIGHHILYGKVVEMNKPFIVIRKLVESQTENQVDYNVEAVVRKKLIFKTRPKPIIATNCKS
ncbi:UNVERIFIED_CONTAM: hypothetical protein RMT77_015802 [Armadillidium vulgare]